MSGLRAVLALGVGSIGLGAAGGLAVAGALLVAQRRATERAIHGPTPAADALVVFGANVDAEGPCDELRDRLAYARALHARGVAPVIRVAGDRDGAFDEADVMRDWLIAHGVPPADVRPLRPAASTRATLRSLAAEDEGLRYIAVSSPYHVHRIAAEARRRGLRMTVSAPASTRETGDPGVHRVRVATEILADAWYGLPERWTVRVHTGTGSFRRRIPGLAIRLLAGGTRG